VLDHRSLPPVFESRRGHIWRLFRLITFGGLSAHLAYLVRRSGLKTSIIIITTTKSNNQWWLISTFIKCSLIRFLGLSQQELDDIVENDSNIVICWKWYSYCIVAILFCVIIYSLIYLPLYVNAVIFIYSGGRNLCLVFIMFMNKIK